MRPGFINKVHFSGEAVHKCWADDGTEIHADTSPYASRQALGLESEQKY